jgi:hypothetical protein
MSIISWGWVSSGRGENYLVCWYHLVGEVINWSRRVSSGRGEYHLAKEGIIWIRWVSFTGGGCQILGILYPESPFLHFRKANKYLKRNRIGQ